MKKPLISLIISTYRSSDLLSSRISNILEQSADIPLEIVVVVNDAESSDVVIIEGFIRESSNIKVSYVKQESLYASWNRAIQMASGEYIVPANTDDRFRNDAMKVFLDYAEKYPEIALFYSDLLMTSDRAEVASMTSWSKHGLNPGWKHIQQVEHSVMRLLRGCYCGPAPLWKRSLHETYGYFDLQYLLASDYDFFLRVAAGQQFKHIPEALVLYLQDSVTLSNRSLKNLADETHLIQRSFMSA